LEQAINNQLAYLAMRTLLRLFCVFVTLSTSLFAADGAATSAIKGFTPNVGQWPSQVLFAARQQNATIWITTNGAVVDEYTEDPVSGLRTGIVTRENFMFSVGQTKVVSASAVDGAAVNFIRGNDRRQWRHATTVDAFVVQIEPGVEHHYSRNIDGRVEREVVVDSKHRADEYRMRVTGTVTAHQVADVSTVTSTVYGSYIGGPGQDVMTSIEYLSNGDVVVSGTTSEIAFPNATGGYQQSIKGTSDGFIARFDSRLQRVRSYTFIGGSGDEKIRAMCRDAQNAIYLAGETNSTDFPITSGVTGKLYKAGIDAFIAKLDSTLANLVIGLYHGGNKDDVATAIASGENGLLYVAGYTNSTTNFPVTFPATITIQIPGGWGRPPTSRIEPGGGTNMGNIDGFIASFSANGAMQQSRFFGRENNDYFTAMAVDKSNSVFLTGYTTSANFETAPTADRFSSGRLPFDNSFNGGTTDAVVVKLNNELALAKSDDGTYSSFFGGNKEEEGRAIGIDDLGRAFVVGVTTSTNLNAVGTLNTQPIGKKDAFFAVVSDDGRELIGCTYYGGTGDDDPYTAKIVDGTSSIIIAGTTNSEDFPFTGEGLVTARNGSTDGFISVINLATNQYATLVAGNKEDTVKVMSIGPFGSPYYVASTTSTDLHVKDSSYSKGSSGGLGGYVAKHAFGVLELTAPTGGETYCVGLSKPISWSALGMPDTTKFRIEYAQAGSNVWQDVIKSVGGRSHSWKVPSLPTGDYVLRISTIYGHLSQLLTPFAVSNPPSIETQPKNVSACIGRPVTMSIAAKGAGLKYQWRKAGVNIPNATESSLTIPALDAAALGKYDCLVSGTCAPSVTSQSVTVSTATPTEITTQPKANTSVVSGAGFTLSVVATGSDLSYQWLKNGAPIDGATTAQYTVAAAVKADEGQYVCDVTGGCGKVQSSSATVVVEGGTSVDDDETGDAVMMTVVGPQPAGDLVYVNLHVGSANPVVIRIIDMQGKVVTSQVLGSLAQGSHVVALSTSVCAAGIYNLQVQSGSIVRARQIQIAR
jgi:hypothetical protein